MKNGIQEPGDMVKAKEPITKTKLVCARCRKKWRGCSSPGRCPDCGEISYPIAVERQKRRVIKHRRVKRSKSKLKEVKSAIS